MVAEHLSGYQARDHEVVDYEMYTLGETGLSFRGPKPSCLDKASYFSCIGAAQTFGCFCANPFPHQVSRELDLPALNLGYGGAGPYFYVKHAETLLDYLNSGRFVVVQVMSGRSESNSIFDSGGLEYLTRRRDGRRFAAAAAWRSVLESNFIWNKSPVLKEALRSWCRPFGQKKTARLLAETRENWCQSYEKLLDMITVPKVLLWISKRSPDYVEDYSHVEKLFGDFPQFVNQQMVDRIRKGCDTYVESVSDRGSPQPLYSRFTGEPCTVDLSDDRQDLGKIIWTHNPYYPSPEMHDDATQKLLASEKFRSLAGG